ncbi:MAG: non-homologous end-joining DNA ligase [Bdellovibrionales bacterium]
MSLRVYNRKRDFKQTPEPRGKVHKGNGPLRFVVQMHRATRLHYDFRLEFDGVFKSWAVPKGPSLNPLDQRLAVFVEDHPIDYGSFEGIIPAGNYGAGTVMLWDEGTYIERGSKGRKDSDAAMKTGFAQGHLTFVLNGTKLKGEFALIKLKKNSDEKAWLLVKKRDEHSSYKRNQGLDDTSVKTGRSMDEIAKQARAEGNVWLPQKGRAREKKGAAKKSLRPDRVLRAGSSKSKTGTSARAALSAKTTASSTALLAPKTGRTRAPMPRKNKPMLATVGRRFTGGDQWIVEPFSNGIRALAEVEGKRTHLYSRAGLPLDKKFPHIMEALKSLKLDMVLDGEIVTARTQSHYLIFDILYFDGRDLRKESLAQRKQVLKAAGIDGKYLRRVEPVSGAKSPKGARVIAKNLESVYRAGTTAEWLILDGEAAGQGLKASRRPIPPAPRSLPIPPPSSPSSSSRSPRRRSVRQKKGASQKTAKHPAPSHLLAGRDEPRLTNLDKVFWPDEGYTKGDLIKYYQGIAPYILLYLKDRPESLHRHPNGIAAPSFYQKDMSGHIPRWLKTMRYFSESADRSIDYVLCQDEWSLLYLVNLGCIEINPWFARIHKPDHPDFMVIDLDPDGNSFDHVIEVAHEVRVVLQRAGARAYCKTSGATGIHIGVPTGARYTFDEVRACAEMVCRLVAKKYPATTSVDRNPNRRRKKIYLDFMQNRRGQTLAAPYCVRPKPGAPVSMPLTWKELRRGLRPEEFHMFNALQRVRARRVDPWKAVLGEPVNITRCVMSLRKSLGD